MSAVKTHRRMMMLASVSTQTGNPLNSFKCKTAESLKLYSESVREGGDYLVQVLWWCQVRVPMGGGGGRGWRGKGVDLLEWHHSFSWALPLWVGWGHAGEKDGWVTEGLQAPHRDRLPTTERSLRVLPHCCPLSKQPAVSLSCAIHWRA